MGDESLSVVASKAMAHYNAKEYAASVRTMQKLIQNQDEDFKVSHNMALAEYQMADCKQPKVLLEALRKAEETMPKTEDGQEITALSILHFNQAVLLTQTKQYTSALTILEQMFASIQHQEDQIGFKVCFLLLDVHLLLKQSAKAAAILEYLSAPNTYTDLSKLRNEDLGSEGLEAQLEKDPGDTVQPPIEEVDDRTKGQNSSGLSAVQFRFSVHLYKTRFYLLNRNYKLAQREIKAGLQLYQKEAKMEGKFSKAGTSEDTTTAAASTSTTDACLTPANGSTALFLKSNLEYLRMNYNSAIKLLHCCVSNSSSSFSATSTSSLTSSSSPAQGPSLSLVYNNLGCIHYRMQKFTSSGFLFTKSFATTSEQGGEFKARVLYNIALQQLMANENLNNAFACFQACQPYFNYYSMLWFRLAECCLKSYQKKIKTDRHPILGSRLRRTVLVSCDNRNGNENEDGSDEKQTESNTARTVRSSNIETPSLEYGIKCLRNALYLLSIDPLPQPTTTTSTPTFIAPTSSPTAIQTNDFDPEKTREMNRETQKMACLVNVMYAQLCLHNPVSCVRDGSRLLAMKNVPPLYRFYAHIYLAEALCSLNAPEKALRELVIADKLDELVNPLSTAAQCGAENHPSYLKAALYCNLATTRIAKNELLEAQECVNHALSLIPDFKLAQKCLLYLQLRQGNTNNALAVLRGRRQPPTAR